MTPEDRRRRARLGALAQHALHSAQATTAAGRAAFLERFARGVDPEGKLDPAERERRAMFARKFYFSRLAYRRGRRAERERAA